MNDRTRLMLNALRRRHDEPRNGESRAWVYAEEVRVAPGWRDYSRDPNVAEAIKEGAEQRIDAFALHTWPSKRWRRVAYEVKASRADLKRELDQPAKAAAALALSNEFYLVVDYQINLNGLHLPKEWGIMRYSDGRLRITVQAPWRDTPLPPYSFMLSLARNIQQAHQLAPEPEEPALDPICGPLFEDWDSPEDAEAYG